MLDAAIYCIYRRLKLRRPCEPAFNTDTPLTDKDSFRGPFGARINGVQLYCFRLMEKLSLQTNETAIGTKMTIDGFHGGSEQTITTEPTR